MDLAVFDDQASNALVNVGRGGGRCLPCERLDIILGCRWNPLPCRQICVGHCLLLVIVFRYMPATGMRCNHQSGRPNGRRRCPAAEAPPSKSQMEPGGLSQLCTHDSTIATCVPIFAGVMFFFHPLVSTRGIPSDRFGHPSRAQIVRLLLEQRCRNSGQLPDCLPECEGKKKGGGHQQPTPRPTPRQYTTSRDHWRH